MGESRRRKQLDPNYGKTSFFITTSELTGKYLACIRHKGKVSVISPHVKKEGAEHAIKMCQLCLDSFSKDEISSDLGQWLYSFIERLNTSFDYEDDDELLGVVTRDNDKVMINMTRSAINKRTADINMESINKTGKRLFTYSSLSPD